MIKKISTDPFLEREQKKYERPIASREYILQLLEAEKRPVTAIKLAKMLNLREEREREALRRRLQAMQRDGQIMQNRSGRYCLINKVDLIAGRIEAHSEGFGFVIPADGSNEDLYLSSKQMLGLLDGDHVLAREVPGTRARRREAIVVEVCERQFKRLVGRLHEHQGIYYVLPDNKRIFHHILIPHHQLKGAVPNQIVVVELLPQENLHDDLVAKVVEILGENLAPGIEIDIAIRNYGLPLTWSEDTEHEIKLFKEQISEQDCKGRNDLRKFPFVTIDGEDAQDFDDAVYCELQKTGHFILYVAIADVSHYVQFQSALDNDAILRGNSVYFPGRVLPMLPEILSNGLCSLKPTVDRLAMVCELDVTDAGEINHYQFYEAIIHSHARLTYTKVAAMIEGDKALRKNYETLVPHIEHLYQLFNVLKKAREKRGAIDFDTTETQIIFDKNKKIQKIVPLVRNDAHRLIEECMLLANVAAARFLETHKISALYRVHAAPVIGRIADLRAFLAELGLRLRGGETPEPMHYAQLLNEVKQRPDANLIQTVLLRSLSQAVYSPHNEGHFGLAYPAYTHFTSPIRRYPDLIVHRIIKHLIKKCKLTTFPYDEAAMVNMGEHCSMTERRADDATRDVVEWLKCEYMLERVGEEFDGHISGVTAFGIFVTLKDVFIEGLVHVTALYNDYYHFDPLRHHLRGERTRKTYRLGDKVRICVANVNLDGRKIDFDLV